MGPRGRTVTAGLGLVLILASAFWRLDVFWLGVGFGLGAGLLVMDVRRALEPRFPSLRLGENLRWALLPIVLIGLLLWSPVVVFASWTTFAVAQFDYMILRGRRRDARKAD